MGGRRTVAPSGGDVAPRAVLPVDVDPSGEPLGISRGLGQMSVQPRGETRMHKRRKIGMIRAAGLGTLAIGGLFLAQGRIVSAQGNAGGGQDSQLLIAHGLSMAIEGSNLQ